MRFTSQVLNLMEMTGGDEAFINIKYMVSEWCVYVLTHVIAVYTLFTLRHVGSNVPVGKVTLSKWWHLTVSCKQSSSHPLGRS